MLFGRVTTIVSPMWLSRRTLARIAYGASTHSLRSCKRWNAEEQFAVTAGASTGALRD
jgi:hypothetical protein